ncbi:MAG: hypothetical protein KJ579_09165, partial [Verrucomicrobia bacterium]|nr:hypothetical protein [Verrucomicrobiota bacterium]
MNLPNELRNRIDAYLDEVRSQSGLDTPAWTELRRDLEAHILDSLARDGAAPTPERLEAVLGRMDPPESFRPGAGPVASAEVTPPAAPRRGPGGRWFAVALAFLALNAWGVWKMTRPAAAEAPRVIESPASPEGVVTGTQAVAWVFSSDMAGAGPGQPAGEAVRLSPAVPGAFEWTGPRELVVRPDGEWPEATAFEAVLADTVVSAAGRAVDGDRIFRFRTAPLNLRTVEQAGLSPDRQVTLKLRFNCAPAPGELSKFIELKTRAGAVVPFERLGDVKSADVLLRTAPLADDFVVIRVRAGLPPAVGTLPLEGEQTRTLAVASHLQLTRLTPSSPAFEGCRIWAYFTASVDARSAPAHIAVEPAVKFSIAPFDSWQGSGLTLSGEFRPGAVYDVVFRPTLLSEGGVGLGREIRRRVQFPHRSPSLAIGIDGRYLSPRGPLAVPVTAVNLRECTVSARPLLRRNLVHFAMREAGNYASTYADSVRAAADELTGAASNRVVRFADRRDETQRQTVDLRDFAAGEPRGAWLVTADARNVSASHRLVVVTDFGLSVKRGRDGVLAWVTSLRDAAPVPGVEVTILGRNNAELGRGASDADGLVFVPLHDVPAEAEPFLAVAEKAGDLSFLRLPGSEVTQEKGVDGRPYLAAGHEAFVFTDRGIYRPGETVHVKALVRDRDQQAPEPFPTVLRVRRPDGRILRDLPAMLDELGAAEAAVAIEDFQPTGRYAIELAVPGTFKILGETSVAVEDFVPPQIESSIDLPEGRRNAAAPIAIPVAARHLFGRAADGLVAEARAAFEPAAFAPKGWDGWSFGDAERGFPAASVDLGRQELDADGRASWSAKADPAWRPPAALRLVAGVTVFEASGRPVSAVAMAPVDVYPHYLGLKPAREGGHIRVGEPLSVAVAAVSPDGKRVESAGPLKATVSRIEWSGALRRNTDGTWSWRSERTLTPVGEPEIVLEKGGGSLKVSVDRAGDYLLAVEGAKGVASSLRFFAAAADAQWVDWSRGKADLVELEADKPAYAPGDRARIAIKAPFTGLALVTLESDRVLERRVIRLEGTAHSVEFEMRPEYSPNVYCGVSLLRPAKPEPVWSAHRAAGFVALKVVPPGRRLKVGVESPETIRPGTRLTAKLSVRDEAGAPASAAVIVAAVDEGICRLTDFETPDPPAFFLGRRALAVEMFDLFRDLMPLVSDDAAGASHTAGGEGAALRRRLNPIRASRFRPVALWASGVQTESNGTATVSFDVPEFTGRLRLMAVAFDRTRAGSAAGAVTVKRPLVVQAGLPRFLAPGDRCDMGVHVFNETDANITARVRVTTQGPLLAGRGDTSLTLAVGANGAVTIPLTAGAAPGKALCAIEVTAGEERYAETLELAVRPAAPRESRTLVGAVAAGRETRIEAPAGWVPESLDFELWASVRPEIGLTGGLDYLLRYPYGCLEQTVSASFPLLVLSDLVNAAHPGAMGKGDADEFLRAGIERVLSMQMGDGRFQVWPNSGQAGEWTSVYAVHFLVEARRARHAVPDDRIEAALDWMRTRLEAAGPTDADPGNVAWQDDQELRAYICDVLARSGKAESGWTARLLEQAARLRPAARAHLAAALIHGGRPRDAAPLLRGIEPAGGAEVRRTGGCFNSRVRDAALALAAWTELDPAAPEAVALARQLMDARHDGRWATTQENAAALLALGRAAAAQPRETEPFRAAIHPSAGAAVPATAEKTARWTPGAPGKARWVRIENEGPGRCYFGATVSGVPAVGAGIEEDRGLRVRRTFLKPNGQP